MEKQRHEELLAALGQLKSLIEEQLAEIHDRIEHITEVVRENTEEIGVLRDAIDDIREDLQWAVRNDKPMFQLTSFPKDPAAPDFADRVNRFQASDLSSEPGSESSAAQSQRELWSDE